jgi:hypothetical protein
MTLRIFASRWKTVSVEGGVSKGESELRSSGVGEVEDDDVELVDEAKPALEEEVGMGIGEVAKTELSEVGDEGLVEGGELPSAELRDLRVPMLIWERAGWSEDRTDGVNVARLVAFLCLGEGTEGSGGGDFVKILVSCELSLSTCVPSEANLDSVGD